MSAWLADSHADPFDGLEHPGAQLVVFISAAPPPRTGSIFYWIGGQRVVAVGRTWATAARLVAIGALFAYQLSPSSDTEEWTVDTPRRR